MPPETEGKANPLANLEAQIESLRGHGDAALERLAGQTDASAIRRRVAILIDLGRYDEAANEIRAKEPTASWADLGAFVMAAVGDLPEARRYLVWSRSQGDANLTHRSANFYVDGAMRWATRSRGEQSVLSPGALSEQEESLFRSIVDTVEPICRYIIARGNVETEAESRLLQKYIDILFLLGDRDSAASVFEVLLTRDPVPIKLGQLALQGIGKSSSDLARRLWDQHPQSFRARFLSCVISFRHSYEVETVWERAVSLVDLGRSIEQREDLCEFLFEMSDSGGLAPYEDVERIGSGLLGGESRLPLILRAAHLAASGNNDAALTELEAIRDETDSRWLRAYANAKVQAGEHAEALALFQKVSRLTPSPDVFRAIADISVAHGTVSDQLAALKQIVAIDPNSIEARRRLAIQLGNVGQFTAAAEQFEALRALQPTDEWTVANLAITYCFDGRIEKALEALRIPGDEGGTPYALGKTRAQILQSVGRVDEAFSGLAKYKTERWDDPEYLVGFMGLAYAAGKDEEANEIFVRLQELQQQGKVDESLARAATIEEVKEWMQGAARRHDEVRRLIVQGKMTWLTAAEIQGEVPQWSWLLRTQSIRWIWDDPLNRASYSIYATNGFRVATQAGSAAMLRPVACPPTGVPIVGDLTALITLHALNLLEAAGEFHGTIYVSAEYLSRVVNDTRKLLPHQRSQLEAAKEIAALVASGRIAQMTKEVSVEGMPLVDEYSDAGDGGGPLYRIGDLLDAMHRAGRINDNELERVSGVAHRPRTGEKDTGGFGAGSRIAIGGATLVTLHGVGLLDSVTREFAVHITSRDYEEAVARIKAFDALDEARAKHADLWTRLRSNSHVRFVSVQAELQIGNARREDPQLALEGIRLAKEKEAPLLADDRVCQSVMLNERSADEYAAFGTDCLVVAMLEEGRIDSLAAGKLLLKLMTWRYRFVLMPPSVLRALALQYRSHPPGDDLRQVARYVHDCMRDAGLFAGLEATSPPVSIAVRLFQSWAQILGEFLVDVWGDAEFSDAHAEELTSWAIAECLPSPPSVLDERTQSVISGMIGMTVMTSAFIHGASTKDRKRVNRGLRAMADALGLSEAEYVDILTKVTRAASG